MKRNPENIESPKITAALYCRVSTYDQARKDFSSLDHQEEVLRDWCQQEGWTVHDVFIETASGKEAKNRPVLQRLLSDARAGRFNLVLITKIDRLARSARDWFELLNLFEDLGIDVNSRSHDISNADPYGRMFRNMLIIFAELERDLIAERTYEKALATAKKGKFGGGGVLIGYSYSEGGLKPDPEYAPLVQRIFREYGKGESFSSVAKRLNEEGFRTPVRVTKSGPNKGMVRGGAKFNVNTLQSIVSNRTYLGIIKFDGKEYPGQHSGIIAEGEWDLCENRKLRRAKQTNLGVPHKSDLLLLGLVKCGNCGSYMTSSFGYKRDKKGNRRKYYYYRCSKQLKFGRSECSNGQINASQLEAFIFDWIRAFPQNPDFKKITVSKAMQANHKRLGNLKKDRRSIEGNLTRLNSGRTNLLQSLKDASESSPSRDFIFGEIDNMTTDIAEVEDKLEHIASEITSLEVLTIDPEVLSKLYSEIIPKITAASSQNAARYLQLTIKEVVVNKPRTENKSVEGSIIIKPWNLDPEVFGLTVLKKSSKTYPGMLGRVESNHQSSG